MDDLGLYFLTVFQSYQDDGSVNMKGPVRLQWDSNQRPHDLKAGAQTAQLHGCLKKKYIYLEMCHNLQENSPHTKPAIPCSKWLTS